MVFSLLATEVPPERRSATLNLVYLPLYAAGIVGPALGAGVAAVAGVDGPFWLGAAVFVAGAVVVALRVRPRPGGCSGRSRQKRNDRQQHRDAAVPERRAARASRRPGPSSGGRSGRPRRRGRSAAGSRISSGIGTDAQVPPLPALSTITSTQRGQASGIMT